MKEFFRTYLAVVLAFATVYAVAASAQTAPLGNGGPSVAAADNTVTVTGGYAAAVNQAASFNWSAAQAFQFSGLGAACPGAGTPSGGNATVGSEYAPVCLGPQTAVNALVIGHTGGLNQWGGTQTASNSGALVFAGNTGTADRVAFIYETSAGSLVYNTAGASNAFNGALDAAGNPFLRGTYLTQFAANNWAGTCAMAAATSCTITIGHSFTTPICVATVQSATVIAGGCTVSGTTVTVTAASSNSSTWSAWVTGNPS